MQDQVLSDKLSSLKEKIEGELKQLKSSKELYEFKNLYLEGKKSKISELMKEMGKLAPEERAGYGKSVNDLKSWAFDRFADMEDKMKKLELMHRYEREKIDLTIPAQPVKIGNLHPVTLVRNQLIDIDFGEDDTVLHNELMFHCRHIFELVAASITFYRFCGSDIKKKNTLFDFTKAFQAENGLIVTDEYEINGEKTVTRESFIFAPGDISMQKNGKIAAVKKMAVKAETVFSNGEKLDFSDEIHDIEGSNNVIMSVMKLFSGLWKGIGRKIGIRRNFYFTNLLPSSLYGVFIQAVALVTTALKSNS